MPVQLFYTVKHGIVEDSKSPPYLPYERWKYGLCRLSVLIPRWSLALMIQYLTWSSLFWPLILLNILCCYKELLRLSWTEYSVTASGRVQRKQNNHLVWKNKCNRLFVVWDNNGYMTGLMLQEILPFLYSDHLHSSTSRYHLQKYFTSPVYIYPNILDPNKEPSISRHV